MKADLGSKLVEAGLVSDVDLKRAQKIERSQGGDLIAHLLKMGVVESDNVLRFLGEHFGTPSVNLDTTEIDSAVAALVPSDVAAKFSLIPFKRLGRQLMVAMVNPANFFAIDDVKFITNLEVEPFVTTEEQVKRAILTLRQMGEMMMDHGVMFAKNLVGTYELLPRLGVYYDLVCRAKAMTDPLHIMHPDVMPVGDGYRPQPE